jgi:hypothetical protein
MDRRKKVCVSVDTHPRGHSMRTSTAWRYLRVAALFCAVVVTCTHADAEDPPSGTLDGLFQSITKNTADAVKKGIDKTLNKTMGNSGASSNSSSTGNASTGSSSIGLPSQSTGSAAPMSVAQSSHPGVPEKIPLTQDQIDKGAKGYYDNCAIHTTYLRNLHDCNCLTEGYKQIATAKRSTQLSPEEQNRIGQTCPAPKATTYAWVYKTCDDYMQHVRTDHAEFCGCTAEHFSTTFQSQPNSKLRKVEALRAESMKACGLADRSHNIH